MIRSAEQAQLVEWLATGRGLVRRYAELSDCGVALIDATLQDIVRERTGLLDRLEASLNQRDDLAPAGDHEVNELHALIDELAGRLLGVDSLQSRLLEAESNWSEMLLDGNGMDWPASEREIIDELQQENRRAIARLHTGMER